MIKAPRNDLNAEFVRAILDYSPETGVLTWRYRVDIRQCDNARCAGKQAGTIVTTGDGKQYRHIRINGSSYKAHRLAWLIVTGEWPEDEIDHEDGDGLNNRFVNLRPATHAENGKNCRLRRTTTSGLKGVSWDTRDGHWRAQISVDGRQRSLGYFDTREAAHAAYCAAAQKYHGEFARVA